ncbi:hypothetical protein ACFWUZ_30080 [Streptomyces sp. NPDC058646]|uniref:hypothetical protein n=1 Tax=Streptomyces sp. NPDC058646 TaxID=3346574 RepID=UPI003663DBFA
MGEAAGGCCLAGEPGGLSPYGKPHAEPAGQQAAAAVKARNEGDGFCSPNGKPYSDLFARGHIEQIRLEDLQFLVRAPGSEDNTELLAVSGLPRSCPG